MRYKYLLFDLDGMLIDTLKGVVLSVQYALKQFGIEAELSDLKPFLGPPLRYSFKKHYNFTEEQAAAATYLYRDKYDEIGNAVSSVFPAIPSLLKELNRAGYVLGVATSKFEPTAVEMLEHFGIAKDFVYITGANIDSSISTKQEVIEEALRRFGITDDRSGVLMIGDMKYDDLGARASRIDSLGVYTGTAQPGEHEEAGATHIAYSFEELRALLLETLI